MLRFNTEDIEAGNNAEVALMEVYRFLYVASASVEEAAMHPQHFRERGIEPESILFGAADLTRACAEVLETIDDNGLLQRTVKRGGKD